MDKLLIIAILGFLIYFIISRICDVFEAKYNSKIIDIDKDEEMKQAIMNSLQKEREEK